MKGLLFNLVLLTVCLVLEAFHDGEFYRRTDDEVIYRMTRSTHSHGKKKDGECRYKKSAWSDCDSSNVQKKTLSLKRGDSMCEPTKIVTRNCKRGCKYEKGEWSDCEAMTNSRMRTDTLKPKSDTSCQPTRTLSKKCQKVCKYNKQGPWSECDNTTGKKSKILVLKSGSPQVCETHKKISKSCQRNSKQNSHKIDQTDEHDEFNEEK